MRSYDAIADLPITVESYSLEGLSQFVSASFERKTTIVQLHGGGLAGLGEEVSYDAVDQESLQQHGTGFDVAFRGTLDGFSARLEATDLFPRAPQQEAYRDYRRWAFESAALDLALRQAGLSLSGLLGRSPQPLRFVVSPQLGAPSSFEPIERLLSYDPGTTFKLDARRDWDDRLLQRLVATHAVKVVDFKGAYKGTPVDQPADIALYTQVLEALPDVWIEDPVWDETTQPVLTDHTARVTWDAPIHSVQDIEALPFAPRMLNLKPSRFGPLSRLFDAYDYCAQREIAMYGGGQFELGPGRGHIQYLASLFHPEGPNDVAPRGYNVRELEPGLPTSPLPSAAAPLGFYWESS